jgi:hypothetical protein
MLGFIAVKFTVKISLQTVSIQRMPRTNFWMQRYGTNELCVPMAVAIQSPPCPLADGAKSSERTWRMTCGTCKLRGRKTTGSLRAAAPCVSL